MRCDIFHVDFDEDQARMFVGHARLQMRTVFKNTHITTHHDTNLGGIPGWGVRPHPSNLLHITGGGVSSRMNTNAFHLSRIPKEATYARTMIVYKYTAPLSLSD